MNPTAYLIRPGRGGGVVDQAALIEACRNAASPAPRSIPFQEPLPAASRCEAAERISPRTSADQRQLFETRGGPVRRQPETYLEGETL